MAYNDQGIVLSYRLDNVCPIGAQHAGRLEVLFLNFELLQT